MKLAPSDLFPLVCGFLRTCGYPKLARKVQKKTGCEEGAAWLEELDLVKVLKFWQKNKVKAAEVKAAEVKEPEETNEVEVGKKRPRDLESQYDKYRHQKFGKTMKQVLPEQLADNTSKAKAKYGQGDTFCDKGDKMLNHTRGKDFRKQKGKLKNKNFGIGGRISTNVNSIKFD